MPYVTSNDGVQIYFTTVGDGEPLVLAHGVGHTWQSWQDLGYVDALKDRYRLILIDVRGHGESGKPHDPNAYTMAQHGADVIAVLDALGIERCHYWAYSIGAAAGYALAAQHPERLCSLIAYGAHPYPIGLTPSEMVQKDVRLLREGMETWVAMLERAGVFEQYPDPAGRRARLLAADPDALIAAIIALYEHGGVADALPHMTMPCLIILAERETAQREKAWRAAAVMPRAQVISVPGIGHAMVHADVIMPYVEPFLASLRAENQECLVQ